MLSSRKRVARECCTGATDLMRSSFLDGPRRPNCSRAATPATREAPPLLGEHRFQIMECCTSVSTALRVLPEEARIPRNECGLRVPREKQPHARASSTTPAQRSLLASDLLRRWARRDALLAQRMTHQERPSGDASLGWSLGRIREVCAHCWQTHGAGGALRLGRIGPVRVPRTCH